MYYKLLGKVLPMWVNQSVTYVGELDPLCGLCGLCGNFYFWDLFFYTRRISREMIHQKD